MRLLNGGEQRTYIYYLLGGVYVCVEDAFA